MLQNGRGANIQNINQNILDNLKIPIPPKEMQDKFFRLVQNIEAQKTLVMQSLRESEDLFNGLVQKAFGCKL
jgi:type I restriction enzyme S subunit